MLILEILEAVWSTFDVNIAYRYIDRANSYRYMPLEAYNEVMLFLISSGVSI